MTRKSYASIKSAQEAMAQIEELSASGSPSAISEIQTIAAKWNRDFKDVDPGWQPATTKETDSASLQKQAVALGAFIQTA